MKNKFLRNGYNYFISFFVSVILIYFFILKITPTSYYYLGSGKAKIFESFIMAGCMLAAAEFVYRKSKAKGLLGPFVLILCILIAIELRIFALKYVFLALATGAVLYIITKANKSILEKIYGSISLFLWVLVILFTIYNYIQIRHYKIPLHTILLIIFLIAIARLYSIFKILLNFFRIK